MFAQFRNVMESLAQQTPVNASGISSASRAHTVNTSSTSRQNTEGTGPARTSSLDSRTKLSLEDRLKATFVLSGTNSTSTSDLSSVTTRSQSPLDPTKIPLPLSPPSSPVNLTFNGNLLSTDPLLGLSPHSHVQPFEVTSEYKRPFAVGSTGTNQPDSGLDMPITPSLDTHLKLNAISNNEPHDDIVLLQDKLKLVEKKFADISTSFVKLQAERDGISRVLHQLSPSGAVETVSDLSSFVAELKIKENTTNREINKLRNAQLDHESRLQELREVHHLESVSQSEQIEKLKAQLQESDKLLAADASRDQRHDDEMKSVRKELEHQKQVSKEEEEKRTKAIGLLKSVRQKLVKTEKEKEDVVKELEVLRAREKADHSREQSNRTQWETQMQALRDSKERELSELSSKVEGESAARLSALQKEAAVERERLENEKVGLKTEFARELNDRDIKIASLEASVNALNRQKDDLFDQLQLRSAELESSQTLLEVLQSRTKEFEFRLRQSSEIIAGLNEELALARQGALSAHQADSNSSEDVARLLLETEGKYESRLSEARGRIKMLEKDRLLAEEEWNRGINEKCKSLERLRLTLQAKEKELESLLNGQKDFGTINSKLESSVERLNLALKNQATELEVLRNQLVVANEKDIALSQQLHDAAERTDALELQLENAKEREGQLKANNKLIRDELRKVQSSVALLERQRNPGIGFWGSLGIDRPQSPEESGRSGSVESSNGAVAFLQSTSEEEINYEYLRNVILQFLEHKERRSSLIRVLSTILRFTPQETRRLMAKV